MAAVNGIDSTLVSLSKNIKPEKSEGNELKPSAAEFAANSDAVVLNASFGLNVAQGASESGNSGSLRGLYESLSLTAKEIVDKINEQLKTVLPEGVQSLSPEEVTPEATADRIVKGVTAFFDIYAKQNKNLQGNDLVDSFISEVTKGVDSGYGDAIKILQGIGAFDVQGVKEGVEKTRSLIDEKLSAFSVQKKKELSGGEISDAVKQDVLAQAGVGVIAVA